MQSKSHSLYSSELFRELRHIESRGLSLNYAEMEQQLIAISHANPIELSTRKHRSGSFQKILSHV